MTSGPSGLLTKPILERWIAVTLRHYRQAARMSRSVAARARECSDVRITHLESGRNLPKREDIEGLLRLYGRTQAEINELIALVEQVRDAPVGADLSGRTEIPGFDTYVGLESGASELDTWDVLPVHGLLQVRSYAEALLGGHESGLRRSEVQRRVDLRLQRQDVLYREDQPLQLRAVIDESVLTRCIAGVEVQRQQLRHLYDVSELPNVSIRVLPLAKPVLAAQHGPFMILTLPIPGDPGLVYLEDRSGGRAIDDGDRVDEYLEVRDALQEAALSEEDSRQLFEEKGKALV